MTAKKLALGDTVFVKVLPGQNNGSDEASARVVRVLDVEGEDRVNLKVDLDSEETLYLRGVLVHSGKGPSDKDKEDEAFEPVYAYRTSNA